VPDPTADQMTMIHVVSDDQGLVTLRVTASGDAAEAYLNPAEARAVADMLDRHVRLAEQKAPTTTSFIGSSPGNIPEDTQVAAPPEVTPLHERA
jgi:hypothetical protein